MNFRSYSDLVTTLAVWQEKLPRDFDLVCGVPRSGLMVASLMALQWNLPVTDVLNLTEGRLLTGGRRLALRDEELTRFFDQPRNILVVEDSVAGGAGIRKAREQLAAMGRKHRIQYAAVYAAPEGRSSVDFAAETVMMPRVFEWNLFHHPMLNDTCVDIDGVLCRDPSDEENDDGPRYREFLQTAAPRFLPTEEVGWLVTSRLEKYRPETEAWLRNHGVRHRELLMLDLPDMWTRRRTGAGATFKIEQYRKTGACLFLESDKEQAAQIAEGAGNHVIAIDTMEMMSPGGVAGGALRIRQELSSRARVASSWPYRAVRFCRRYLAATRTNLQP